MSARLLIIFLTWCAVAAAQTGPFLSGVWSGNVSSTSATVAVRLNESALRVRLHVSRAPDLSSVVYSAYATTAAATGNAVKLTVQGLQPDTEYFYGIEVAGVLRLESLSRGRFRTFPLGRGSFKIAFGSCSDYRHPDQSAFAAIVREKPLLFIHTGDLHYSDTNSTNPDDYRVNYDEVLKHAAQSPLYRNMPVAYVWDDHDFAGNNADTTAIGRDAARAVYRERVPHYPLGAAGGAVAQAFTVGRVRVVMTDLRSASVPSSLRESASKTRMGTAQKNWFKQELINARDSGFPLILWVCPDPWIAPAQVGDDTWGGHATERTEIANFIRDNRVSNVVMISGDMHALAYDDGTNSDFSTGGGARMVVLHAAALTADPSSKGGPYSGGVVPGNAQFGVLEVYDTGGPSVACRFLGMNAREGQKLSYIFSSSSAGANHALVNISTLGRVSGDSDVLVSGFVISGANERSVLVRAIGPTLAGFGVSNPLSRPQLGVFQGPDLIASNDAWGATPEAVETLTNTFDRAGAFRLVDSGSSDAALFLKIGPGAYTVQVRSGDGSPGTVLLEVYDLP